MALILLLYNINNNMKTNFQKVKEFHETFELDINDKPQFDVFTKNPKLVKLRMSLIDEEVNELREAMKNHDMKETVDALADILYVVYGTGVSLGFGNLDNAFDIVHQSNMSKACVSEEEAIQTINWYKKEYTNGNHKYDTPTYKKSKDDKYWIVYNKSSGKILKSINYKPVDFNFMLQQQNT